MEKQEMYSLCVLVEGAKQYNSWEGKNDERKRGHVLMFHETLKGLDDMTSQFSSFDEMNEEIKKIYGSEKNMFRPIIYVDKDINDLQNSYYINHVVYREDAEEINNRDNIKNWLLEYLNKHPENICNFGLFNNYYLNTIKTSLEKSVEYCLRIAANVYFNKEGYTGYRTVYFKLKDYDLSREKNHGSHK